MNAERKTKSRIAMTGLIATVAALGALWVPATASADFGLNEFDLVFSENPPAESLPGTLGPFSSAAGSHPDQLVLSMRFNTGPTPEGGKKADEPVKDILVDQVPGLVGAPTAVQKCSTADFLTPVSGIAVPDCPASAALGVAAVQLASKIGAPEELNYGAVYNLAPPPGTAARLGFWIAGVPVTVELGVNPSPPYNITGGPTNISQVLEVVASKFVIWGDPADPTHDPVRGVCLNPTTGGSFGKCEAGTEREAFLTLPRSCEGPLDTSYRADSWINPGDFVSGSVKTHDEAGNPKGMSNCGELDFSPEVGVRSTTSSAESASGLQVAFDIEDPGVSSPDGNAAADIAATELRLPAGMTVNPSAAEGLGVCTEGQLADASPAHPGCPSASKLGELEVDTPLFDDRTFHGSFYQAAQEDNPFDSLLAAYLVVREPGLGVLVKLAAKIDTDPHTGQIVTTVEHMPPFPLERVRVRLRSGPRAPLVTPPECGTYETEVKLTPSSGQAPLEKTSEFEIDSGPGGSDCPSGAPPFSPGFAAGSANNAAGAYSPFLMRLTRQDGEQDLTKFSAALPPGVTARLAGLAWCPDAAIARASGKDGRDELGSPSCPASSKIGRVVAGAGVGTALTYVDGSLYLSGPYNGAPLSVVAIVPAVAGPFDVGTVVTRVGLRLNPKTGQGEVDGAASDPIPHILEGIPLKVRDIRVLADRPSFTLNPTSCQPSNTFATIWGGGSHPFSAADDLPFGAASRFQAASCAALQFKPKLAIKLRGGVKRGAHPALRAIVTPPPGQANFARAVVTLPRSAFLEQAHIRTICTRVQFNAPPGHGAHCPPGARYGFARAWSPLLDAPAQGPVFLRSSDNNLPDLVVALKGPASAPVDVELSSRIDSVRGGIRSTFTGIPDLPVSRFILDMQGGKKGLIVNSRHLCHKPKRNRATANLRGQNGRFSKTKPRVIATTCAKRRKARRKRAKRSAQRRAYLSRASAVGAER